jgi:hypothetical protein
VAVHWWPKAVVASASAADCASVNIEKERGARSTWDSSATGHADASQVPIPSTGFTWAMMSPE